MALIWNTVVTTLSTTFGFAYCGRAAPKKKNQTIPKGLMFRTCAGHVGDTVVYYIVDHEGGIVVRGGSACLCFTPGP